MTEELMKQENGLMLINEESDAILAIDKLTAEGVSIATMKDGMVKSIKTANFIQKMKSALTSEVMGAIMSLQNSALGFKTDKQDTGYPEAVVRECAIEAFAFGIGVTGNQFNIIGGNMYVAKNGANTMLKNMHIRHFEDAGIPELFSEKDITYNDKYNGGTKTRKQTIYKQPVTITWVDNEGSHTEEVSFLINVNNAMGPDAIAGKAIRKARMWLVARVTGMEIPDAEVEDTVPIDVTPKEQKKKVGLFKTAEKPSETTAETTETKTENAEQNAEVKTDEKIVEALAAIDTELQNKGITDVTAADIKATCEKTNNKFNPNLVLKQIDGYAKWVRQIREKEEAEKSEAK